MHFQHQAYQVYIFSVVTTVSGLKINFCFCLYSQALPFFSINKSYIFSVLFFIFSRISCFMVAANHVYVINLSIHHCSCFVFFRGLVQLQWKSPLCHDIQLFGTMLLVPPISSPKTSCSGTPSIFTFFISTFSVSLITMEPLNHHNYQYFTKINCYNTSLKPQHQNTYNFYDRIFTDMIKTEDFGAYVLKPQLPKSPIIILCI